MYTNFLDIKPFTQEYLGISLDEIAAFSKSIKVDSRIILETIMDFITNDNGSNICFPEIEKGVAIYCKAISVYKKKCLRFVSLVESIARGSVCLDVIEFFDLKIENGEIATSDLIRLLKPLKCNYEIVKSMFQQIENKEDICKNYLKIINHAKVPNSALKDGLCSHSKFMVDLTPKQIDAIKAHRKALAEKCSLEYLKTFNPDF